MGWGPAPVTTLVVPSDASDTDPRTVITGDIPPELQTYYSAKTGTPNSVVSCILEYTSATVYRYHLQLKANNTEVPGATVSGIAEGWVESGTVNEDYFNLYTNFGAPPVVLIYVIGDDHAVDFEIGNSTRAPSSNDVFNINTSTDFQYNTISQGRDFTAQVALDFPVAVGNAGVEAIMVTSGVFTYPAGRAFEVSCKGSVQCAVAGNATMRIHRGTTIAGTTWWADDNRPVQASTRRKFGSVQVVRNNSGADIVDQFVITLAGGSVANPMQFSGTGINGVQCTIRDIGKSSDYPGFPAM